MKKVELLAPAGSMEALHAAVQNGCDAVYLGGSMFGARAFANNFDENGMVEAISYAHTYGVKVYVTMNTLLFEEEIEPAYTYACFLYKNQVDAIIIQDVGLFDILHQRLPDLELHCSTQMHIHNEAGIQVMQEAGAKRVVVPRETSIQEIASLAKLGCDLEVFVQGALCVAYSGQCLMSAKKLNRSGNRGACAQMCRMKYRLIEDKDNSLRAIETTGKYLLSPKDLTTLSQVPQLIDAGIASFKIEGRMKRAEYVALMVAKYRKAIDDYYAGNKVQVSKEDHKDMEKMFHRGFTAGHLFQERGSRLMNFHRPNHMGVVVGEVIQATKKRVTIKLSDDLQQGDGIRFIGKEEDHGCLVNFLYKRDLLVNSASRGDIVEIDYADYIEKGSQVVKSSDVLQLLEMKKSYTGIHRRVSIEASFYMKVGRPCVLTVRDEEGFHCSVKSDCLVEKALKTPLDQERIQQQLRKCKDTVFQMETIQYDMDKDAILPIKEINRMRRDALINLHEQRANRQYPQRYGEYHRHLNIADEEIGTMAIVHTQAQYESVKQCGISQVYTDVKSLYEQLHKQDGTIGYVLPRIHKQTFMGKQLMSDHGSLKHIDQDRIASMYMNITNSYAAAFLFAYGVRAIVLSTELHYEQRQSLQEAFQQRYHCAGNFIVYAYGHEELMICEYCMINACILDNNKKNCSLCRGKQRYYMEDVNGNRYPLQNDEDCRMHILDFEAFEDFTSHKQAKLLSFSIEDSMECQHICKQAN